VALQNLPVLFCMDRAGLSPNDGATHHGLFDLSCLRCVPNTVVMAPANEDELADMIATGIAHKGPAFVRYPRGKGTGVTIKETPQTIEIGKAQRLRPAGEIELWAIGAMVTDALQLAEQLEQQGISAGVVNARFVKPLDSQLLLESVKSSKLIVTFEDNVLKGGFGSAILEALQEHNCLHPVERIGWPDKFIDHGSSVSELRASLVRSKAELISKINEIMPAKING
jgi:1-deoxy-D-xylulose-5-phosphate synthase